MNKGEALARIAGATAGWLHGSELTDLITEEAIGGMSDADIERLEEAKELTVRRLARMGQQERRTT